MQLKRKLSESNIEMERMRNEMMALVRSVDQKDDKIRNLERKLNETPSIHPDIVGVLKSENDSFRQENRMLKEKVIMISNDMEKMSRSRVSADPALEIENRRLRNEI